MKCYLCKTKKIIKEQITSGKLTKTIWECPKCGHVTIEEKGEK